MKSVLNKEPTSLEFKFHQSVRALKQSTELRRNFPFLMLLVAGSGCAALIYEIVWFQLLQLVIGSSAVSLGLLLAAYMGGLCLGSALLPRIVSASRHPFRVYSLIELAIAKFGLLALWIVPLAGRLYLFGTAGGSAGPVLRGLVACICLIPPALLMGASLPAIARWLETTPRGVSRLGFLYSSNIAGGVFGTLLAGFYLLRVFDMSVATYIAVAVNVLIAAAAFALSFRAKYTEALHRTVPEQGGRTAGGFLVFLTIALSGFCALGAEVVWTRLLSLLLGGTVYTFSIILAVFLIGLCAGSAAGSFLARRIQYPRLLLGGCQLLLALSIAWTAYALAYSLPGWPVDPWLSLSPWSNFELDLVRCIWAVFPAVVLWGACFPLALACARHNGAGSRQAFRASVCREHHRFDHRFACFQPVSHPRYRHPRIRTSADRPFGRCSFDGLRSGPGAFDRPVSNFSAAGSAAAVVLGFVLGVSVSRGSVGTRGLWSPNSAYGAGVRSVSSAKSPTVLYRGEGMNSSVVIVDRGGERTFYVSGKVEASTALLDMRLERMMGHVPALLNPNPKTVLTVGFGAGVTAGSFVPYPELERLVICEIEPFIPPASTQYFGTENNWVFNDPRTHVVYDDAQALHCRDRRKVRRHYNRSHSSMGQRNVHALFGRIL